MATKESRLIVSLIDRLTAPARGVAAAMDRLTAASRANAARLAAVRGQMLDAAAGAMVLYKGISAPVKAAMAFESAMADVKKVVDFETPQAFRQMGLDIRELSTRLPMAADGIAQIVAAAGQSGLANNELLGFAEMAAKVAVAWDVTADQAGEALAKLKTALGLSVAEAGSLADAINYLGNKTAASAPDILDVTRRTAPMAKQFGMTAEQAAAFGAAMVGAGFEAEVAATSYLNMGRHLTMGASATKRQVIAMKELGLNAKTVAKNMQKDAIGTIMDVFARLRAAPAAMRASLMTDIFGKEARALGPLITNEKLLAEVLALVAEKSNYAGSAQAEYEERAKTTENALQLFQNRVTDLAVAIGNALLPALNSVIDRVGPIVTNVADLAQRFPQVTAAVVGLTAALVGFKVAAIAANYAGLFVKGAFLDAGIAALSAASSIGRIAFAPVVAGFNALRTAMVGYAAAAAVGGHGAALSVMGQSLLGLLNPIRLVTTAFQALKFAVIGTGIGAIVVGIAMAGAWIYNNWSNLAAMFKGFGDAFMLAISPLRPVLDPVVNGVSSLVTWVTNLVGPIDGAEQAFGAFGVAAGRAVGQAVMAVVELPGKIAALAGEMLEAGKTLGKAIYDGVVELIAELAAYIKNALSNAISSVGGAARNLASRLTFGLVGGDGVDGARASGGPVRAGGTYLVGERGPELFRPRQSGFIEPNAIFGSARSSSPAAAHDAARHIEVSQQLTFYVTSAADPRAIADEIAGRVRSVVEGAYSDGAYA